MAMINTVMSVSWIFSLAGVERTNNGFKSQKEGQLEKGEDAEFIIFLLII
jgi:hypothetical protein